MERGGEAERIPSKWTMADDSTAINLEANKSRIIKKTELREQISQEDIGEEER